MKNNLDMPMSVLKNEQRSAELEDIVKEAIVKSSHHKTGEFHLNLRCIATDFYCSSA